MIKILSGEKRGFFPFLIRLLLLPLEFLYFVGASLKVLLYRIGFFRQKKVEGVKIICVGNLSAGGTGKTPAVLYLLGLLQKTEEKIAVVSRGYKKSKADKFNDEGNMINAMFPDVLQFQNPDRYSACMKAKKAGALCIILDDGFSHMKLARDFDIVLIDATCPFSNLELLPRGLLREPLSSLKRASVVIITRSDQVSNTKLMQLNAKISKHIRKGVKIMLAAHKPVRFVDVKTGQHVEISELKDKKTFAFTGIGNPNSFLETLINIKLRIIDFARFPDHHSYTQSELENILTRANEKGAEIVVTTSKDAIKISKLQLNQNLPIYSLEIEFAISKQEEMHLINLLS